MRRRIQQHFAFAQCFCDEPELTVLEISQAAVNELAAGGARARAEVALLDENDAQSATRGVACYARTVDAAPNDEEVSVRVWLRKMSRNERCSVHHQLNAASR